MSKNPDREYEQLRISGLHAFYGESHILHGIDMVVQRGELVTLLGRNGAGRSTRRCSRARHLRSVCNLGPSTVARGAAGP